MHRFLAGFIKITILTLLFFLASYANAETLDQSVASALIDENGHAEIPSTYTVIGSGAFSSLESLKSVYIPDSITDIKDNAFRETNLRSVVIPDSVIHIESYAFFLAPLSEIFFGNSLETIGDNSFQGTNLTTLILPDSTKSIGSYAFRDLPLTHIYLGESLSTISNGNFGLNSNCNRLISADIRMQTIPNAFNCTNLESISLKNTVEIKDNAFVTTNITSLSLPDSLLSIGRSAFSNVPIEEITFGDSLSSIRARAFNGSNIAELNLPNSLVSIGEEAFQNNSIIDLVIPDNVESIGYKAFSGNSLKSVSLGTSLTSITSNTFMGINSIEHLVIKNKTFNGLSGAQLNQLKTVIIEEGVESISSLAYTQLTEVEIPSSVVEIQGSAFSGTQLKDIDIPSSVTKIGSYAFSDTNITEVVIPPSINDLANFAFANTPMERVIIIEPADISFNYAAFDTYDPIEFIFCANIDSDLDGAVDCLDAFPMDASESQDADLDGIGNNLDTDDDNDGYNDALDAFPNDANEWVDTDLDGIGNNSDNDDDGDGAVDSEDAFPLDETQIYDITGDILQVDSDGDGILDVFDPEPYAGNYDNQYQSWGVDEGEVNLNTDGDSKNNWHDPDDDNDGLLDVYEPFFGTNPLIPDSDFDGVLDGLDAFPMDNTESLDTDTDGIGNNTDTDDDNDGHFDLLDAFPLDANEWMDSDSDGIGNNADLDDDNDGVSDDEDAFPYAALESVDTDGDGVGDNADAFPNDSSETVDTDLDGIGNNADDDDDNDGVADADDSDPLNDAIGALESQDIFVMGNPVPVNGYLTNISVGYDVSDNNNQLNGIGFRVHYDDAILDLSSIQNTFEESIVVNGIGPYQDVENFDGDTTTNTYLLFGWASLNGFWPNISLPVKLTEIQFFVNSDDNQAASIVSNINFSTVDNAEGYEANPINYPMTILPATWDFDGNGKGDALTDGLMLLRYTFGLRDSAMTAGAIAEDATLSTSQVALGMEKAMIFADIDGNGSTDALTDGLMLLRYMFGLRGDSLIRGSVSSDASRVSEETIEDYITLYMPENTNVYTPITPALLASYQDCSERKRHQETDNDDDSSDMYSTIVRVDDNSVKVSIVSANDDPIDYLNVTNLTGPSAYHSDFSISNGEASLIMSWLGGAPDAASFDIYWSKESYEGNWFVDKSIQPRIDLTATCDGS